MSLRHGRQIPTTKRLGLKVGLTCEGVLVAGERLDGYQQVGYFSEHMRKLGCQGVLLGSDEVFGCDMLFALAPPPKAAAHRGRRPVCASAGR